MSNHFRDLKLIQKEVERVDLDKEESELNAENEQLVSIFGLLKYVEEETIRLNKKIDFYLAK